MDHSRVEIDIRLQEFSHRLRRDIAATRERDVRMEWTQIRFETNGEGRIGHALVQLKKVRMPATDADPNNFRRTFRRKCAETGDRQEECTELDCTQPLPKLSIDIFCHIAEEAEREMHLLGSHPADAVNLWIKIDKKPSD